ncbi:MAG: aminotransferase class I/II-fold pyridoxal phosphate-dependent enzyme [Bacteroidetes bacterium]|jgi:aspartate aminotransferase|nr:aminotransferase class I/II-fold pyridoxal phosphate-dependent enzyme [Bacteroidota bacterium]
MPKLSERSARMPESPIRKLVPLAEQAVKKGIKVHRLNIGQPDIHTSPEAMQAIRNIKAPVIEYTHSAGLESLRKKLVEYYKRFDIDVTPDDMIITTGGSEAISITLLACLNPGDEIIVPEPFYANYFSFATTSDVNVTPITSVIDNNYALPSIEAFESKITNRTKAIIICNPNNPTGYLYSREELEQIRHLVKKHDLYLLADEVYRELVFDGEYFPAMHLKGIEDNLILIDSMSKRYSATGLRTGALVTKNKDLINTALKFGQARLAPPYVGQIAGEAAIDTSTQYLNEVHAEYKKRRDFIVDALNKMEGVVCPMPKGAFYCMAKLPVDDAEKFCQWILSDFSYNNQSVMLAPASGFYSTKNSGKQEVRLAFVLNVDELKESMECLKHALLQYPGRDLEATSSLIQKSSVNIGI